MRPNDTSLERILNLSTDDDLRRRFLVVKEPIPGNLRFGVLLEVLDRLAADTAVGYARAALEGAKVVTAAVDEIVVRGILDPSVDLRCAARINHVGRSSMEVGLRLDVPASGQHLASSYFTMVARDGDGSSARSISVPPLELGDDLERLRARRALERREAYRAAAASAMEPPSREEFDLMSRLHRAQEHHTFQGLLAGGLTAESWERTYPEQENESQIIFGGYIMRRAYELSSICAERVATHRPVIAAVNRINFFHPVRIGDKLRMLSRVVYTQGAALCVETGIERVSRDRTTRALSNSCLFTFVNLDPDLVARAVPEVHPSDWAEDGRFLAARRTLAGLRERMGDRWIGAKAW
jgi:acyl-coenzyme A thioesterase 9